MGWYITIQEWMRSLGLKGNDLIVFAFLNGYSQQGQGYYFGGLAHLQEVCGISTRATAIHILQSLCDEGLITREESGRIVAYRIDPDGIRSKIERSETEHVQKLNSDVQKLNSTCSEIEHIKENDNKIYNNINNNIIRNSQKFDFREELISRGVPGDVADDWLKVRKAKRASNTRSALSLLFQECEKASISVAEAVEVAAANSWQGFRAEWYWNLKKTRPSSGYGRQSAFESALQAKRDLANFGSNMPDGRGRIDEQ